MKRSLIWVVLGAWVAPTLFSSTANAAPGGFWCQGNQLDGEPIWLDVDYLQDGMAEVTLTVKHFSGSTGEVSYEKAATEPVQCESLGNAYALVCRDPDSGRERLRAIPNPANGYVYDLSTSLISSRPERVQFFRCEAKR